MVSGKHGQAGHLSPGVGGPPADVPPTTRRATLQWRQQSRTLGAGQGRSRYCRLAPGCQRERWITAQSTGGSGSLPPPEPRPDSKSRMAGRRSQSSLALQVQLPAWWWPKQPWFASCWVERCAWQGRARRCSSRSSAWRRLGRCCRGQEATAWQAAVGVGAGGLWAGAVRA